MHNGIEYGDLQLIAEAYDVRKRGLGLEPAGWLKQAVCDQRFGEGEGQEERSRLRGGRRLLSGEVWRPNQKRAGQRRTRMVRALLPFTGVMRRPALSPDAVDRWITIFARPVGKSVRETLPLPVA